MFKKPPYSERFEKWISDNKKSRAPSLRQGTDMRYPNMKLKPGTPAAHRQIRLMLLPSGPDMVHGRRLHGTRFSALLIRTAK